MEIKIRNPRIVLRGNHWYCYTIGNPVYYGRGESPRKAYREWLKSLRPWALMSPASF